MEQELGLLKEGVKGFFDLVVKVGGSAVEDARGFAGAVEEEERGDRGDIAEGLGCGGVGDSPMQVGAERTGGGADLVFRGFDGEGEDGEFVTMLTLQLAEPLKGGAAGRTPGGPEFDEDDATGELSGGEGTAGKIGESELGKRGNLVRGCVRPRVFPGSDVLFTRENQVNHANEVSFELCLAGFAAPRGIPARAFDFAKVAELPGSGDENVIHEDGGVAFHPETVGQLGSAKIFSDESNSSRILGGDFLDQQTCRVGDISSVGPADQGEVDGFAGG